MRTVVRPIRMRPRKGLRILASRRPARCAAPPRRRVPPIALLYRIARRVGIRARAARSPRGMTQTVTLIRSALTVAVQLHVDLVRDGRRGAAGPAGAPGAAANRTAGPTHSLHERALKTLNDVGHALLHVSSIIRPGSIGRPRGRAAAAPVAPFADRVWRWSRPERSRRGGVARPAPATRRALAALRGFGSAPQSGSLIVRDESRAVRDETPARPRQSRATQNGRIVFLALPRATTNRLDLGRAASLRRSPPVATAARIPLDSPPIPHHLRAGTAWREPSLVEGPMGRRLLLDTYKTSPNGHSHGGGTDAGLRVAAVRQAHGARDRTSRLMPGLAARTEALGSTLLFPCRKGIEPKPVVSGAGYAARGPNSRAGVSPIGMLYRARETGHAPVSHDVVRSPDGAQPTPPPATDLERLKRDVIREIERSVRIERQRQGRL